MGDIADYHLEQMLDNPRCEWCDGMYGKHDPDCPTINAEEVKKLFKGGPRD